MAQISKGDTFVDGQQVTGARLNQLLDASTLLQGSITDQSAITASTVAIDDQVLLSDTSATALRKATVADILGSSLPVVASSITGASLTTSVVNAGANSDIVETPNDGANVTGKTFTSADGITATVSSTAHGLVTGQNLDITASNTAYSGVYQITVTTVDAFTYVLYPTTTAASGTCSYIRKGTVRIVGSENISGNSRIAGNQFVTGGSTITGNLRVVGTTILTGSATLTGVPTAPTASALTNTTQIATTAFVRTDNQVKAWVNFNGTGTVAIRQSFNVTSITDNAVGNYTINFTSALVDNSYATVGSVSNDVTSEMGFQHTTRTTSAVTVLARSTSSGGTLDLSVVNVAIFR